MAIPVHFDAQLGEQFLRYARLLAKRGYVHNTLGNMAMRAPHPDHPHGVAYTKHAEISLEEMGIENIVITEIADQPPAVRLAHDQRRPQPQPRDPEAAAGYQRGDPRAR